MTVKGQKTELNQHHDELVKMEGLLMRMEARLSECEMAVAVLREEVKGKSNVVEMTGEEDKENEADTLGSPYVLTQQWIERDRLDEGILAPIALTSMEDFDRVLGEVVRASGWGPGFLKKNPDSSHAYIADREIYRDLSLSEMAE